MQRIRVTPDGFDDGAMRFGAVAVIATQVTSEVTGKVADALQALDHRRD
jgi:hypothetical protein